MGRTRGGPERHALRISALRMPFLPPEILTLIFMELSFLTDNMKNSKQLQNLRLVSKDFDKSAQPIVFHTMTLTPRLVNWPQLPDIGRDQIIPILQAHAQKIRITTELDWANAARLLSSCEKFKDLLWTHLTKYTIQLPHQITTGFHEHWPHVQLHLSSTDCFSVLAQGLPTSNITRLHFTPSQRNSNIRDERVFQDLQLKDCVVSSPNLTHLTTKLKCPFDPSKGRLPPIKSLRVEGESRWTYSLDDARRIWNFSRLETLYLERLNFETFTRSVRPTDFLKLQTIQVYQQKPSNWFSEAFSACTLLGKFLQELPMIETIIVNCFDAGTVIDAFSAPKPSVRLFHASNYTEIILRTLELKHIEKIDCTFPGLRDLFVDIEYLYRDSAYLHLWGIQTEPQLRRLSIFKALNTLYISTVAGPWVSSEDLEHELMRNLVDTYFRPLKTGQPLRKLVLRQSHNASQNHVRIWDLSSYYWDNDGRRYLRPSRTNGFKDSDSPPLGSD